MNSPSPTNQIPTGITAQIRRHARSYLIGFALLAVYQTLAYGFDRGLWYGIDATLAGSRAKGTIVGAALVVSAVVAMGVRVLSRVLIFNGGRDAEYELRRALLDRLHVLGPAFYRRMPTGEIMSRATNDLSQVRALLGFGILNSVNTVFALASALAVVMSISYKLTIASLLPLPVLAVVTRKFSKATFGMTRATQAALGKMSDRVQASLAGVRVIKSFALEEAELASFQETNRAYLDRNLALAQLRGSMGPIMQALATIGVVIVFVYGGRLVLRGEISAGGFVAFFWASQRLAWPIVALGFVAGLIARGRAAYTRLQDIFRAVPDVTDGPRDAPLEIGGELVISHLTFSYREDSPAVLHDVSFRVKARQSVALVGRTGSGKSTIAGLLPRLLPTPRGTVLLDGVDVCDLPLAFVRRAIGHAQQDAFLFSTSVERNIALALADPDAKGASDVVRMRAGQAQVLDDVLGLPERFETMVGERGVQLSGGQKQRVALARALAWEPRVLVLDDPMSAVDTRTEAAILDTIEKEAERRTVLLITHRIAAARRCDWVVVLDAGRVVEQGTHEELMRAGGVYARFAEEQILEEELAVMGDAADGGCLDAGDPPGAGAP